MTNQRKEDNTSRNSKDRDFYHSLLLKKIGLDGIEENFLIKSDGPYLITNQQILEAISRSLEGKHPLAKVSSNDINSRILIEVDSVFPKANDLTKKALGIIEMTLPHRKKMINEFVYFLLPLCHEKYGRPFRRGFSSIDYLGIIFTSYIERKVQDKDIAAFILGIDIIHEFGHQVLMYYQASDPIISGDFNKPVYSSIRRENRPAIFSLHACVATGFMLELCDEFLKKGINSGTLNDFSSNTIKELLYHQKMGLQSLERKVNFTSIGEKIFEEMVSQEESLSLIYTSEKINDSTKMSYFGLLRP